MVSEDDVAEIERVKFTPILLQEYVPKDVELRITVVGEKVFPVEIHSQLSDKTKVDWRKILNLVHRVHTLLDEIKKRIVDFVNKLGLNFGAIDMILPGPKICVSRNKPKLSIGKDRGLDGSSNLRCDH